MISYYNVFDERCRKLGKTSKEYITNNAHKNFLRVLESSPNSIMISKNKEEETFPALTLTNTDKDIKDIRAFCVEKETLNVGDFIHWDDTYWLVYNKEIDTVNAYDKFEAIYCQHIMKWIDEYGVQQEMPVYTGGLANNLIKLFYNRSNSTVVLDPAENNYLGIIAAANKDIPLGQRIVLGKRAWKLIESDYITVPGICYLSFTEDKLLINDDNKNNIDDINNDIANVNDKDKFSFKNLPNTIEIQINGEYIIDPTIYLNGNEYKDSDVVVSILDDKIISYDNMKIVGKTIGETTLVVKMRENIEIEKKILVTVVSAAQDLIEYNIIGNDSIKVGKRTATYEFKKFINGENDDSIEIEFFRLVENKGYEKLVTVGYDTNNNGLLILTSNNDNKIGEIELEGKIVNDNMIYKKTIKIKSLWG